MSDTSRVQLYYVEEEQYGVTPALEMGEARFTGESLGFNIENITSNEIRSDRQITDLIQTGAESSGDINFEMSFEAFDDFLAGSLFNDWVVIDLSGTDISVDAIDNSFNSSATDLSSVKAGQFIKVGGFTNTENNGYHKVLSVTASKVTTSSTLVDEVAGDTITIKGDYLRNGTTKKSFSMEKLFSDISKYINFKGMVVGTTSLNVSSGEILNGSFGFMGKDSASSDTSIGTGAPVSAPAGMAAPGAFTSVPLRTSQLHWSCRVTVVWE